MCYTKRDCPKTPWGKTERQMESKFLCFVWQGSSSSKGLKHFFLYFSWQMITHLSLDRTVFHSNPMSHPWQNVLTRLGIVCEHAWLYGTERRILETTHPTRSSLLVDSKTRCQTTTWTNTSPNTGKTFESYIPEISPTYPHFIQTGTTTFPVVLVCKYENVKLER